MDTQCSRCKYPIQIEYGKINRCPNCGQIFDMTKISTLKKKKEKRLIK